MKKLTIVMAVLAVLWSCSSEKKAPKKKDDKTSENFNQFLKDYNEGKLKLNPIAATYAGDNRFNNQFPNFLSDTYQKQKKAFFTSFKEDLGSIEPSV